MAVSVAGMTAEELFALPEGGPCELVEGELVRMAPAGNEHGYLASELAGELRAHVKANNLGRVYAAETGFKLSSNPDTVRAPDVAFVSRERLEQTGPVRGYWPGAPDLAVEVVSPSDLFAEVNAKIAEYLAAGSRAVVVVNPSARQVFVHTQVGVTVLAGDGVLEGGEVVPGWQLQLRDLFAEL